MSEEQSSSSSLGTLLNDRSKYGHPKLNLGCQQQLRNVFRAYLVKNENRTFHSAEIEAIEMCLVKIGRIANGEIVVDNYDDLMGYAQLAKDIAKDQFYLEKDDGSSEKG